MATTTSASSTSTRGSKAAYTAKQKRQAKHIEDSALESGRNAKSAKRIAWATVNKQDGGGQKKTAKGSATTRQTRKASSATSSKSSQGGARRSPAAVAKKAAHPAKQKKQAKRIETSEVKKGRSNKTAKRLAWSAVNKRTRKAGRAEARRSLS